MRPTPRAPWPTPARPAERPGLRAPLDSARRERTAASSHGSTPSRAIRLQESVQRRAGVTRRSLGPVERDLGPLHSFDPGRSHSTGGGAGKRAKWQAIGECVPGSRGFIFPAAPAGFANCSATTGHNNFRNDCVFGRQPSRHLSLRRQPSRCRLRRARVAATYNRRAVSCSDLRRSMLARYP